MTTAGQTADFNSSAGAEIKVVTKRGTSAYHGTVYEYYKDNNWSGNTWQNNFNSIPNASQLPLQPLWRRDWRATHPGKALRHQDLFLRQLRGFPLPQLRDHQQERRLAGLAAGDFTRLRAVQNVF